ncbi:cytochrome P450 [Lactarius hatsudake]|nr:cytochrome P450 [Lactarius hatsudake]
MTAHHSASCRCLEIELRFGTNYGMYPLSLGAGKIAWRGRCDGVRGRMQRGGSAFKLEATCEGRKTGSNSETGLRHKGQGTEDPAVESWRPFPGFSKRTASDTSRTGQGSRFNGLPLHGPAVSGLPENQGFASDFFEDVDPGILFHDISRPWTLRNEADIRYQNEVGDCEFKWMREYGSAWRRTGCLGTDRLVLADPKALKHVLHSAGYHYPKTTDRTQVSRMVSGNGLVAAEGRAHHRQRKIISPAFSAHQIQSFLPVVPQDRVKAGFDLQFGSLDNLANPLVIRNDKELMTHVNSVDSMLYPSWYDLIFKETWKYIPRPLLEYVRYIPTREYRGFRSWLDNVRVFSEGLIKLSTDKGDGNDIMSVLLRANASSNPKNKMADNEMVDQIATFISAGHETSAKSLTWYFYAIAKHPETQVRIREEIALVRARAAGDEFTIADLNSMTYTLATLKESMRLDPILWLVAEWENRLPDVWGEDANDWNPERFLDPLRGFKEASSNIGVFGSLVLEMQIIILTLVENFEFSLPPQNEKTKIYRRPSHVMLPMREGQKGTWMGPSY